MTYPDAVIVPEGTEPRTGLPPAFHADFFLVIRKEHASLFDNHAAGVHDSDLGLLVNPLRDRLIASRLGLLGLLVVVPPGG